MIDPKILAQIAGLVSEAGMASRTAVKAAEDGRPERARRYLAIAVDNLQRADARLAAQAGPPK